MPPKKHIEPQILWTPYQKLSAAYDDRLSFPCYPPIRPPRPPLRRPAAAGAATRAATAAVTAGSSTWGPTVTPTRKFLCWKLDTAQVTGHFWINWAFVTFIFLSFSLLFECCGWYDVCTYVIFYQSPCQSSSISSIQQRIHFHRSGQVGQRNGRDTAVAMRFMLWMAAITVLPWNAKQHQHL